MNVTQYDFFRHLTELPFIDEIWLYGSRARGDFSEESDIDLAIIAPRASDNEWQKVTAVIANADTLLKIDCIHFDKLTDKALKKNIIKDKVILFKRNMNTQDKINQKIMSLEQAIERLNEAVQQPIDSHRLAIDGTIQRFEFSFELFWKTIRYLVKEQGVDVQYPKETLKIAFQSKLISHEDQYVAMLNDRNETSHIYDVSTADRIYRNIKNSYVNLLKSDTQSIKKRFYKN